ncbi:MAG: glycosyltransferase [Pararhodobacter sp.]
MDSEAGPLISVIVPVFNVADLIGEAIASLRAQSLTDFEALVIDDGSTDGSGERAAEAFAGDPRFRLIRQDNQGLSGARNTGLDRARGAFVAFLDSDDALAPGFLQTLHEALQERGTDWAACGITLVYPDAELAHPALHAATEAGPPRRLSLTDAREVVRVFPSAWNKLYRRSLFDGLRFPDGIWFEDHEVFWALAARAPALAYVPDPLYRHRRERPGQITGADEDRVFDQLRVLDRLHPRVTAMAHGVEGYAMLATRLVHERALVLRNPARRSQFLTATWALFARLGVVWTPGWDPEISRALGFMLAGEMPLSVVVLGEQPQAALAALAAQGMTDMEVLVTGAEAPDALPSGKPVRRIDGAGLTPAGLAGMVTGRWVLLLAPGEAPLPEGLMRLVNLAEESGAPLAIGALERATRGYHDGWTDNNVVGPEVRLLSLQGGPIVLGVEAALRSYPALANRLIRRDLLATLPDGMVLSGGAVAVQSLVLASALAAPTAGYTRLAVALVPDRPEALPGMIGARRAAAALAPDAGNLPAGWRGLVFFRLVRLRRGSGVLRWSLAGLIALGAGWLPAARAARPDPESPRWFRWLVTRWQRG